MDNKFCENIYNNSCLKFVGDEIKYIKPGQKVRIKTCEQMIKEYGSLNNVPGFFPEEASGLCGKITEVDPVFMRLYENNITIDSYICFLEYDTEFNGKNITTQLAVSVGMVDPVYENNDLTPYTNRPYSLRHKINDILKDNNITREEIKKEMLSKVDLSKFNSFLKLYSPNSEFVTKSSKKLLDKWCDAKLEFYILLGRELKVSYPIVFERDMNLFVKDFFNSVTDHYPYYAPLMNIFKDVEIFNNQLIDCDNKHINNISLLDSGFKRISNNMKFTKFISQYINNKQFDQYISQFYQDKEKQEMMYISIDPCDYLTMSFNKSNWRTCSAPDGVKRYAPLNHLGDEVTLVSFIPTANEAMYRIGDEYVTHNNKKYRSLVYINKDNCAMSFNKIYPKISNQHYLESLRHILMNYMCSLFDAKITWDTYILQYEYNTRTVSENVNSTQQNVAKKFISYKNDDVYQGENILVQSFIKGEPLSKFKVGISKEVYRIIYNLK